MGTISSGPAALAIDLMAVPPAMTDHDTKGCRGRIYPAREPVARALIVHAIDPDSNPVVMIIAPKRSKSNYPK
jgi:hypothetical protein